MRESYHRIYELTKPDESKRLIDCISCKFSNGCKLHAIVNRNQESFVVNGITTATIATNCKNFNHFNN